MTKGKHQCRENHPAVLPRRSLQVFELKKRNHGDALQLWLQITSAKTSANLTPFSEFFAALLFLRRRGNYEQIKALKSGLFESVDRLCNTLDGHEVWRIQARASVRGVLQPILRLHAEALREAKRCESALKQAGWKFDPQTGMVKKISGGHRRKELLNEIFVHLFKVFSPGLQEENVRSERSQHKPNSNSWAIRNRIRQELSQFFPPDLIDPRRNGRMCNAINAYLQAI